MKDRVYLLSLLCASLFCMNPIALGGGLVEGQVTWEEGNGHSYAIVSYPGETWLSASTDITTTLPGYHLATITSQAEQDFVWNFLNQTTDSYCEWWLGGFQNVEVEVDPSEGWEWVTGEDWFYTHWAGGEPNNAGGIEDHLALDRCFGGYWNDEGTALGLIVGYIAERSDDDTVTVDKPQLLKRTIKLSEVNFPPNPKANATIRISQQLLPEEHPNSWLYSNVHTMWDIQVSGLHCTGHHQQPDGHAEWTRQASYALYVNGLRLLTFNEGCNPNNAFGEFKTTIDVFVSLPFDPFEDNLVGEIVPENDDGMNTCAYFPCENALLRGEDIVEP